METINYIMSVFEPANLLACVVGALVGTLVGVLPGLGTTGAMALLLPLTYTMDPVAGLIMLAGIWYGSLYGGSTSAILVNIPGEAASVATTLDGHAMAKQGRAGAALAAAAIGSFVAGTIAVVLIQLFAPPLASVALAFGPREYFAIALFGLIVLSNLTGASRPKSFIMLIVGLMLATVGLDPISGSERFTFGSFNLFDGFGFIPVVMGLFGVAEVLATLEQKNQNVEVAKVKYWDLYPTREDLRKSFPPMVRGGLIGFMLGLIPGPAAVVSSFLSYSLERRISKHPERFGTGEIAGVAGPEAANNAAGTAGLVPLVTLGIPFAAPSAVLLTGMIIQGITPGPLLIASHPEVFWGIVGSMYLGNIILLVLNLPLVGMWASLARIKSGYLMPTILLICALGAYGENLRMFDLWVMLGAGVIGYVLKRFGYSPTPLVIGLVLGSMVESNFIQSMIITGGSVTALWERPIAGTILTLTLLAFAFPFFMQVVFRKKIGALGDEE